MALALTESLLARCPLHPVDGSTEIAEVLAQRFVLVPGRRTWVITLLPFFPAWLVGRNGSRRWRRYGVCGLIRRETAR